MFVIIFKICSSLQVSSVIDSKFKAHKIMMQISKCTYENLLMNWDKSKFVATREKISGLMGGMFVTKVENGENKSYASSILIYITQECCME